MFYPRALVSHFANGNFMFPKDEINPKEKGVDYIRRYGNAIMTAYFADDCMLTSVFNSDCERLRLLARGEQPVDKYKKFWRRAQDKETPEDQRVSYRNIDWNTIAVLSKPIELMVQKWFDMDFRITLDAIDERSALDREKEEAQMKVDILFGDQFKKLNESLGIKKIDDGKPKMNNLKDIDTFKKLGGLKLKKEIAGELLLENCNDVSEIDRVRYKCLYDAAVLHFMCMKDETDLLGTEIRKTYIDPAYFVCEYSREYDMRNSSYAGYVRQYTIADLRRYGIPEEQLRSCANFYNGIFRNPRTVIDEFHFGKESYNYDNFNVLVFDFEFYCVDNVTIDSYTPKALRPADYEYKPTKVDKQVIRGGKLILGTDIVFDAGIVKNNTGRLSFHAIRLEGKSPVEKAEPFVDNMHIAWQRFQNDISKAKPKGEYIDFAAIRNISLASGNKLEPQEVIDMYFETGTAIGSRENEDGRPLPSQSPPIIELNGGLGSALNEFIVTWNFNMTQILDINGFNNLTAASTPKSDQLVGTSEISANASTNAIKSIFDSWKYINVDCAKSLLSRFYFALRFDDAFYKKYYGLLGKELIEAFVDGGKNLSEYGIKVNMMPTQTESRMFFEKLMMSMEKGMISAGDGFYILNTMKSNLKLAEMVFAQKEQEAKQMVEQKRLDAEQMNTARMNEAKILDSKLAINELMAKTQGDIQMKVITGLVDIIKNEEVNKATEFNQMIEQAMSIIQNAMQQTVIQQQEGKQATQQQQMLPQMSQKPKEVPATM